MKQSNEMVNLQVDQGLASLNAGYLRTYDGTEPATANAAITTQTVLHETRYGSPAFLPAIGGSTSAAAIADAAAIASGTPTWFRAYSIDGTTVRLQGSAGLGGTDLVVSAAPFTAGQTVSVLSHTYTLPKS